MLEEQVRKYAANTQVSADKSLSEIKTILEKLLEERERVMRAIPACPLHGNQCVPQALEWISKQVKRDATCSTCRFWKQFRSTDEQGKCVAPDVFSYVRGQAFEPTGTFGCNEHKPKRPISLYNS